MILEKFEVDDNLSSLSFSPDSNYLILGINKRVEIWDFKNKS